MIFKGNRLNIRIKRIELKNFKNIEFGAIDFPNSDEKDLYEGNPSILGLYGQNGSGKSSVIMALGILKNVLSGKKIGERYISCIRTGCDCCTLSFTFSGFCEGQIEKTEQKETWDLYYDFDLKKRVVNNYDDYGSSEETIKLVLENEVLKIRKTDPFGKIIEQKRVLFDTRKSTCDNKQMVFGCNSFTYFLLTEGDDKIVDEYREAKIISKENGTSFIFSDQFTEIPLKPFYSFKSSEEFLNYSNKMLRLISQNMAGQINNDTVDSLEEKLMKGEQVLGDETTNVLDKEYFNMFKDLSEKERDNYYSAFMKSIILSAIFILKDYGQKYLYVVDTITSGIININNRLPLLLWKRKNNDEDDVFIYKPSLSMDKPTNVLEEYYEDTKNAINAISGVLNAIIPDLSLDIADYGIRILDDNKKEHRFEILSKRNNQAIPLKYESDGIRRIISILSLLIAVYNEESFTVAIDEIDSGIFEYLLGEMLLIMCEKPDSAKGQLIFTSHNLRPLEVLPTKYLCFTTTNLKNRYTTMSRRGNSNMRDTYFRKIKNNSINEKYSIYNFKKTDEIKKAFYKAGHHEEN